MDRQSLLNALCQVKNGKSTGNCTYPVDLVENHNHIQLHCALAQRCSTGNSHSRPPVWLQTFPSLEFLVREFLGSS